MTNTTNDGGLNLDHLEALAPCPFCGATDPTMHPNDLASCGRQMSNPHTDANYGHCDSCGADGPVGMTDPEAREMWNRRAAPVSAPIAGDALPGLMAEIDCLNHRIAVMKNELQMRHAKDTGDVWYWQGDGSDNPGSMSNSMTVVINAADLRAALTNQPALTAAPEQVAGIKPWQQRMAESGKRECADLAVECLMAEVAELRALVSQPMHDEDAERASQPSEAAPLDAYEMTRLRRLMKALGQEDAFERDDEHVRGSLCVVLGIAAGRIEGTLPGPAAASGQLLTILRDVHDTLESQADSDIDHFEDDEEEREAVPMQYAARRVMEAIQLIDQSAASPVVRAQSEESGLPEEWRQVLDEVARATRKFPTWPTDPLHAIAVLGEEFGELTKAVLQTAYEPHKVEADELRTEAVQTAAMALRFVASLDSYEFTRCAQHSQDRAAIRAAQEGGA